MMGHGLKKFEKDSYHFLKDYLELGYEISLDATFLLYHVLQTLVGLLLV